VRQAVQIGAHSMAYLTAPYAFKEMLFREAAAVGASGIRVDVELSGIFPAPEARRWSALDDYIALARRYHLAIPR
jgi:hypothetical protein